MRFVKTHAGILGLPFSNMVVLGVLGAVAAMGSAGYGGYTVYKKYGIKPPKGPTLI